MPWHILAPAAVACDIYIVRRSAHPRGAFFTLQESNFLYSEKGDGKPPPSLLIVRSAYGLYAALRI